MTDDQKKLYSKWLNTAFLKRQISEGERMNLNEFATFLGLKKAMVSHYMNGRNLPSYNSALLISEKLNDFEGMKILGFPIPRDHSFLPADLRRRLDAAEEEVNRTLEERGLTGEMPDAETVTIEIFGKWGFKYVKTDTVDESSIN